MVQRITATSIGQAWLGVSRAIMADGRPSRWGALPMRELLRVTVDVTRPDPDDPILATYADPARLAWMHANFADHASVAALGDADSYATRLYDYAHTGLDQIAWVINRLAADPMTRDATITTLQPLTDTTYVPCVSLLDFWIDGGLLQLGSYAHGIDFGTKGYANLVELAAIHQHVAQALGAGVGTLTMAVKSAHVYESEFDLMTGILDRSVSVPAE